MLPADLKRLIKEREEMYNRNFTMRGGLAYTEDEVVVFNIFAFNVPKKAQTWELAAYFSQFGGVKKVTFYAHKRRARRNAPKVAYIYFIEATSAAQALQDFNHLVAGGTISVKACDSWCQPLYDDRPRIIMPPAEFEEPMCLLDLNDDSLVHVFRLMRPVDQITFARTCVRLRGIFYIRSNIDFKVVLLSRISDLTLWQTREFFELAGETVQELRGTMMPRGRERIIQFIGHFCKQLRKLHLEDLRVKTAWLYRWLGSLKELCELSLINCKINDNAIRGLELLPNLQKLNLHNSTLLSGKYLPLLRNITEMDVSGCRALRQAVFIQFFASMRGLRIFNMKHCNGVSSNVYQAMAAYCKSLEELKFSCYGEVYKPVALVEKLRYVELFTVRMDLPVQSEFLEALSTRKDLQLQVMKMVGMFTMSLLNAEHIGRLSCLRELVFICVESITDLHLIEFEKLVGLERLDLSMGHNFTGPALVRLMSCMPNLVNVNVIRCSQLKDDLVFLAIRMLDARVPPPEHPLVINVAGTSIVEHTMLRDPRYLSALHLLRLVFVEEPDVAEHINQLGVYGVIYHLIEGHENNPPMDMDIAVDGFGDDEDDGEGPVPALRGLPEPDEDAPEEEDGEEDGEGFEEGEEGLDNVNANVNIEQPVEVPDLVDRDDENFVMGYNVFGRYNAFDDAQPE